MEELLADAHAFVQKVWDDVERDIDALVQVESVEDVTRAAEGAPFGPGPREALERALAVGARLGLACANCDGYVGVADVPGADDQYIATIAHADIVPVGAGWNFDPLRVTSQDGYLIGRGVLDDKGPLVLSLYAASFVASRARRKGVTPCHTLRCIVGTNEETGMADVDYYLEHFPQPLFCFTPDAEFPAICGEKGRVFAEVLSAPANVAEARIVRLEGGEASNAITGIASALVVATAEEVAPIAGDAIRAEESGSDEWGRPLVRLVATGKGGHAAMPEDAHSAVGVLCEALLSAGICTEDERAFLELEGRVFANSSGSELGIDATDPLFKPLTCAGTMVRTQVEDGSRVLVQGLDIRYPPSITADELEKRLERVASAHCCNAYVRESSVPFLTDPDSPEVRTLLGAYSDVTGRKAKAFTIGGGTYARHFNRAVAFGPVDLAYEAIPSWIGPEHGPDEGVSRESLQLALEVYAVALARLLGV